MQKFRNHKLIAILLVALMMLMVLCGCGADKDKGSSSDQGTNDQTAEQEAETSEVEETADMIPVIAYHKIKPYSITDEATSLEMFDTTFEEQMNYLKENGFTTLTPDEFYQWYKGEIEVPKKSVLITLDDGYYGTYYYAYPVIKRNEQAATVFTIGHLIDDKTAEWDPNATEDHYIGFDVIEEARKEYPRYTYESHTFNMHKKINKKHPVDVFTREQMDEDIKSNERFGFSYLAYPWGDYNDDMKAALKDAGYKMAFSYGPFAYATRNDDQYAINRVKISGKIKLKDFIEIVNCRDEELMP